MSRPRPTLLPPPPLDPACCALENDLQVTALGVLGEDLFTNTRPTWHPAGARGIFGGSVVALSVAAAQRTVGGRAARSDSDGANDNNAATADDDWVLHSAHCYFLLAGNGDIPILFHVERIQDGRSYAARTVQARQRGRCIFTVTLSFVRRSGAASSISRGPSHAATLPSDAPPLPPPGYGDNGHRTRDEAVHARLAAALQAAGLDPGSDGDDNAIQMPIQGTAMVLAHGPDAPPQTQRTMQWVRVRGRISAAGGRAAHLAALAFLTDRFFIGTIARLHRLWWYPVGVEDLLPGGDGDGDDDELRAATRDYVSFAAGGAPVETFRGRPTVGMTVSRDHTLYIHAADRVRVDEWMLVEMATPWAGEGRGVVSQRIFSHDGTLLASCMQEGLVRLRGDGEAPPASEAKAKL